MLTTQRVRELIAAGPVAAAGAAGLSEAERRFSPKGAAGYVEVEQRALDFLAALRDTRSDGDPVGYRHPARDTQAARAESGESEAARRFGQSDGVRSPLAAADIAWVSALPPAAEVSYRDAVELCSLAGRVEAGSADERLVMSKWLPVKSRHDRADAEAAVAAARRPWPAIAEAAALEAMVAALEKEPEVAGVLSEREMRTRAKGLVTEAIEARDTAHRQQLAAAEHQLAAVQREQADREALTAA